MNRALLLLGAGLVALIGVGQSLHDGSEIKIGSDQRLIVFIAVQMLAAVLYWCAARTTLRGNPGRRALWLVLGVAAAMRAIPLCSPMFLSSDLFRYIWDGRVQLAGINPYRYVPGDPALAHLRDAAIFSHVNRAMYARTIYPPAAELTFAAIAWIGQTPFVMRAAMVAFEAVAVAAMCAVLRRCGLPMSRVLIYAWNPLAVWEFAGNGHVDALAIGFLALAFLAFAWARPGWTGVALACAVLTKFLPAVVAPALWRRWDWRLPATGLLTAVALYAVYVGAGRHVLGFLPGYAAEEGLSEGSGFWALSGLAELGPLPGAAAAIYAALLAVLLGALGLAVAARPRTQPPDVVRAAADAALLIVVLLVGFSPHYSWYYPWVCLPAAIAPHRGAIFLGAAALLLYIDPLHESFIWQALVFVPTVALTVWDVRSPLADPRRVPS